MQGSKIDDHLSSAELCLAAAEFSERCLRDGGWFVCKIMNGPETSNFKTYLKTRFRNVRGSKPPASRKESREMYIVCSGYVGREKISEEVGLFQGPNWKEGVLGR
jgi:23S rRNA (uridine2552-2'-O)-methyltransferase